MAPMHVQLGKVPKEEHGRPALNWVIPIARVALLRRAIRNATTAGQKAVGKGEGDMQCCATTMNVCIMYASFLYLLKRNPERLSPKMDGRAITWSLCLCDMGAMAEPKLGKPTSAGTSLSMGCYTKW